MIYPVLNVKWLRISWESGVSWLKTNYNPDPVIYIMTRKIVKKSNLKRNSKTNTKRSKVNEKEFEKVLAEIESPQDWGNGFWDLPENPTPLEKVKYELCEKVLGYQEDNNLSDEKIAKKINLTLPKTQDILFCRIEKVNWDNLLNAISKIFSPAEIKVVVERKKDTSHVWVI